jgi:hydroxymethylglutaryl-CoA lyase
MKNIVIHDVGLRDGLQAEKTIVPTETKLLWLKKLIEANIKLIQVGSFVNPQVLPQMSDTDKIFELINNNEIDFEIPDDTTFSALILNEKGLERAIKSKVKKILMGVSASETHSQKNTRMTVSEATIRIINIAKEAISLGAEVQVSVQSAFGCGYEGKVPKENVLKIIEKYLESDLKNISLADTAGHANPTYVKELFSDIKKLSPDVTLACHFHNTYGLGLLNVMAAVETGVEYIETAFGGLGGCPFTKVAAGNVPTEDVVHLLQREGYNIKIDTMKLIELAKQVSTYFNKELPGFIYKTGPIFWS